MVPTTTRNQTILAVLTGLAVAITRFAARSCSPWDWDELLFESAVRSYDVTQHHPHPPGYPLFISLAKVARLAVPSDYTALQVVVMLGALLLFPAAFLLAREAGFEFPTALLGALIASFMPNIWFYGGTAFSDIPGAASAIIACALFLRGCRDSRAYLAGALLLGISLGIRPQNILMALLPGALATISQLRRHQIKTVVAGVVIAGVISGACYIGAGLASSSFSGFIDATHAQERWLHDVDSFHNVHRTPLSKFWKKCLLWPAGPPRIMRLFDFFAVVSLLDAAWRRRKGPFLVLLTFLPMLLLTWLLLTQEALPRYAVAYVVAHALLAADGIAAVTRHIRRPGAQWITQAAMSLTLVILLARWTWPAIAETRSIESPPSAAFRYVREHARPHVSKIYVHGGLGPQGDHDLEDYAPLFFEKESEVPAGADFVVTPIIDPARSGHVFTIPRQRLWEIARQRNFEVQVREPANGAQRRD